jgi:NTP pyrophosphatase (non-canonical NTP hydrolase)
MNANDYQHLAKRTLWERVEHKLSDNDLMLVWNALALTGEAGEIAELVKKGIFHRHGIDRYKLADELGDVLWYVAALCTHADLSLSDVMRLNIEKLKERYPNGFSTEDSRNRIEYQK